MAPAARPRRWPAHAVAAVLLGLTVMGSSQGLPLEPDDGGPVDVTVSALTQAVRDACDEHTKQCVFDTGGSDEGPPPHDYQWWMVILREHLDRDTRQLLLELWPESGIPPAAPLPPRPQQISANASLEAHLQASLPGVHLDVHVAVQANVSASSVGHGGPEGTDQVPCSDPRGCPDLVVDGSNMLGVVLNETFAADDCNVREGSVDEPGERRVLRFTTTVPNIGDGDLFIGDPEEHPEWFVWGDCHNHWHFRDYSDYRLWTVPAYLDWWEIRARDPEPTAQETLDAHPGLRDGFVAGHKQGFCVIDVRPYLLVDPPEYWSCSSRQGISRGWADQYHLLLDGQFIDVTGLPPGPYVLEVEANPERLYQEIDYANNAAAVLVFLPPGP